MWSASNAVKRSNASGLRLPPRLSNEAVYSFVYRRFMDNKNFDLIFRVRITTPPAFNRACFGPSSELAALSSTSASLPLPAEGDRVLPVTTK